MLRGCKVLAATPLYFASAHQVPGEISPEYGGDGRLDKVRKSCPAVPVAVIQIISIWL